MGRLRDVAHRYRADALVVVGLSVLWPYFRGFFLSLAKSADVHAAADFEGAYAAFSLTLLACALLAIAASARGDAWVRDARVPVVAGATGCVGMALLWLPSLGPLGPAQCVLGAVANAAFFVLALVRYACVLDTLPMRRIIAQVTLSFGLCYVSNAFYLLPVFAQAALCVAGPLVAAVGLALVPAAPGAPVTAVPSGTARGLFSGKAPLALFILLALFCVAGNLLRGVTNPWFSVDGVTSRTLWMSLANVVLVVAMLAMLRAGMPPNRIIFLSWAAYMLLFFAGLLVMVAPGDYAHFGSNLATVSRVGFTLLMLLLVVSPEWRADMGTTRRVALFLLAPEALAAVVRYIGVPLVLTHASVAPDSLGTYCGIAAVFVLSTAIVVVLGGLLLTSSEEGERVPEGAPAAVSADELVIADIAARHALTPRETDVLRYVARGYALENTAEELGVSINTVRTHTRSIYAKLGVHTRQEVVELAHSLRDGIA